jgi:S-adenosylmethionine hydrolase
MKIITFLSDFGYNDWFVAAVKGEILKINNSIIIVDISHTVHPHDIRSAAYILKCVYENFPSGTVHLAVVDPGVGSERKPLIVKSDGYYFVGPDNGVLSYIYNVQSEVYAIKITGGLSSTFHARDVFGPVAAKLTKDKNPEDLGIKIRDFVTFEFPQPQKKADTMCGEIVYIDYFGNCITNIENNAHITELHIKKDKIAIKNFYGEGMPGEIICVKGSSGYYEIACDQGNACDLLHVKIGTKVVALTDIK